MAESEKVQTGSVSKGSTTQNIYNLDKIMKFSHRPHKSRVLR